MRDDETKGGRKWRWALGALLGVVALSVLGTFYVRHEILHVQQDPCEDVEASRRIEVCKDREEEWFKYGSLGSEVQSTFDGLIKGLVGRDSPGRGIPYPIFHALPRVFGDLLPGPGGYRAFGIPWEEGRELPVGFSRRRVLGFDLITQNCAICHTATYRIAWDSKPVVVPTGPSHTTDVMAFLDFLAKVSKDPRLSADGLMYDMNQMFEINWLQKLLYRHFIIPFAKRELQRQALGFAWIHAGQRPAWGPGRDAPFNLTKFFMLGEKDDGTVDNADFPSIWSMDVREGTSLNWAGETPDPLTVFIDSALGLGAPPSQVRASMERMREYLRRKRPPKFPFRIDETKAEQGRAVWETQCADCHDPAKRGNGKFGKAVAIDAIGTDRERYDTWQADDAKKTNEKAESLRVKREHMVKDIGYVSQPLDGIWLRAPYLHNGSVPTLRDLLRRPHERPATFWRGCDVYDPLTMGFENKAKTNYCPRAYLFDTRERGNGNAGHTYGTDLADVEKDALVEYLKKL